MKATPVRIVLAFYSADEGPTDRLWKSLNGIARVCVVRPDASIPASCSRYAALRLEGEVMVMAETQPANVESVVKVLQLSGSPAIFAVDPDDNRQPRARLNLTASPDQGPLTRRTMLARLRKYKLAVDAARQDLVQATRLEHALSPAAAWILDNTYLIRTQLNEVERHLPRDYSAWAHANNGHGDIHAVAQRLVAKADYLVTEASIRECLNEAQTHSPFTIAELWAFPLFLRIALVKELAELADARQSEPAASGVGISLGESAGDERARWRERFRNHAGASRKRADRAAAAFRHGAGGAASGRGTGARPGTTVDRAALRRIADGRGEAAQHTSGKRSKTVSTSNAFGNTCGRWRGSDFQGAVRKRSAWWRRNCGKTPGTCHPAQRLPDARRPKPARGGANSPVQRPRRNGSGATGGGSGARIERSANSPCGALSGIRWPEATRGRDQGTDTGELPCLASRGQPPPV